MCIKHSHCRDLTACLRGLENTDPIERMPQEKFVQTMSQDYPLTLLILMNIRTLLLIDGNELLKLLGEILL